MNLRNANTGERLEGVIESVRKPELSNLSGNKNLTFDWIQEKENQVFKITLQDEGEILGLISLIDIPKEFRIHLNLIESIKPQRGKSKTIENIPGCLIAHACRLAFNLGYDGFVSLTPKTKLMNYYKSNYGFIQMGKMLVVFSEISNSIIEKYFGHEKI